ncbi:MAG: hypothetical protein ACK5LT_07580 [Lachnospirales bacterium]
MINYEEELKKFDYIKTVEEVGKAVEEDSEKSDVKEILEFISKRLGI